MGFDFFSIQVFNPRENSKDMMTIDNRQKCELPAEGPPRGLELHHPLRLVPRPRVRSYCQTVPERGEGGIFPLIPLHGL